MLEKIREANQKALGRIISSEPQLVSVRQAKEALPKFQGRMILHAGPPLKFEEMCDTMKGAIWGAVVFEGWAPSIEEAMRLVASGSVSFSPNHHHNAVGPMSGITSPSMYMYCVKDKRYGTFSFCNLNEGLGRVLRFGAYDTDVIKHLQWLNESVGSILQAAVKMSGPVPLKLIMQEAVRNGDECHNRHLAGNKFFVDFLRPFLIRMGIQKKEALHVLEFIDNNYYSFLNISLAACKCMADAALNIPYSTTVTALSRNGKETGIRVAGLDLEWFCAPSNVPAGKFFEGYSAVDANADMGDSTITETVGLGAFAMSNAPEIVTYLGGNSDDIIRYSHEMYLITGGENTNFPMKQLGKAGSPLGIDIMKVCATGITPLINTGIAHKRPGIGQIGAGYVRAPIECFQKAIKAFEKKYGRM